MLLAQLVKVCFFSITLDAVMTFTNLSFSFQTIGVFDLGVLGRSDPIPLVVGIPSASFPVTVAYAGVVTLTPASTDGIVFTPASLTFGPGVDTQYVTLTATSLGNRNPVVTWSVSGAEASRYVVPPIITVITVSGRSLTVTGDFGTTLVNTGSTPILITSDYTPNSLTITPTAANLVFTPPSQTLSATTKAAAFTAVYPSWKVDGNEDNILVQFVFSGADADLYNPLAPVNFKAVKSKLFFLHTFNFYCFFPLRRSNFGLLGTITVNADAFSLEVNHPGLPITFTLQAAPESDVSLSFCNPAGFTFRPPVVAFSPGQLSATTVVSATAVHSGLPTPVVVGIDVIGTDANKYYDLPAGLYIYNINPSGTHFVPCILVPLV